MLFSAIFYLITIVNKVYNLILMREIRIVNDQLVMYINNSVA